MLDISYKLLRQFAKNFYKKRKEKYHIIFVICSICPKGTKALIFACLVILHAFWSSVDFFFKLTFSKKSFRNTIRVSNSLDPDQAWSGLIWVQTVCKGYQQTTKISTSGKRVTYNCSRWDSKFFYCFSEKIRLGISCESSASQILLGIWFSWNVNPYDSKVNISHESPAYLAECWFTGLTFHLNHMPSRQFTKMPSFTSLKNTKIKSKCHLLQLCDQHFNRYHSLANSADDKLMIFFLFSQ